jgi:hypothetical protein
VRNVIIINALRYARLIGLVSESRQFQSVAAKADCE